MTIPENVTLTLEPGVEVIGQDRRLVVRGVFGAVGTASNRITLENVVVTPDGDVSTPHTVQVEFAHVKGGGVYPAPIGFGNLVLRDSVVEASRYLYVWYPVADSYIERNLFVNTGGISVGTNGNRKVYVRNNVFWRQTNPHETYAVDVWAAYNTSETVVKGNSFLSTDRVALRLTYDTGRMDGTGNYWGGASDAQIPSMIFDQNDDPALTSTIPYQPVLSSPDPATPSTAGWIP